MCLCIFVFPRKDKETMANNEKGLLVSGQTTLSAPNLI